MPLARDLARYARFARSLRRYLADPLTLEGARERTRRQLDQREESFLHLVRRGVYEYPGSPYLPLLRAAGCEYADLRDSVRRRGLEAALLELRRAGVYVTFEEIKGREPIVRSGVELHPRERDFDNPTLAPHYHGESSGSTGAASRVPLGLDHLENQAVPEMLTHHAHGVLDVPHAVWRGILPDGSGIHTVLRAARYGRILERWFDHVLTGRQAASPWSKHTLATFGTVALARAYGVALPWPERVPLDQAHVVAGWMQAALRESGRCVLAAVASRALRVCRSAEEAGIDLTGATFRVGGEPFTPAKQAAIARTGARAFPTYGFVELGRVGMGCAQSPEPDDVHLVTALCALIQHPRKISGSGIEISPLLFTSLSAAAPKILLNAESDDLAVVETRECGCPLQALGFSTHLRGIRSFRKLTGEGVSIVASDLERILEEALPARFGGSAIDYQIVETEDGDGRTRLDLLVSPSISLDREAAVVECVLDELRKSDLGNRLASEVWSQARALRVRRAEPIRTDRGKLMSLRVARANPA